MKKFDVFQLPDGSYRAIKYGFNWPSFFFTWIWCFFVARLYGWGIVWVVVWFAGKVLDAISSDLVRYDAGSSSATAILFVSFVAFVGLGIWFSSNANDFRRRKYIQMGYSLVCKEIDAPNQDNAISKVQQEGPATKGEESHQFSPDLGDVVEQVRSSQTIAGSGEESKSTSLRGINEHSERTLRARGANGMSQSTEKSIWSEEFNILYEYATPVKECHDELEAIEPQLSEKFREEVVLDRKKAPEIRDRLKAEHEENIKPFASEDLNKAFAEARLLGPNAEEEFTRIVEVMGEDIDVDDVSQRLKKKYGELKYASLSLADRDRQLFAALTSDTAPSDVRADVKAKWADDVANGSLTRRAREHMISLHNKYVGAFH